MDTSLPLGDGQDFLRFVNMCFLLLEFKTLSCCMYT